MGDDLVWYAAYGSNVDRRRFNAYLSGGPVPGTTHVQGGSRDSSPPRRVEPFRFGRSIRFAHHSRRWNGATAVLDHEESDSGALGRRYLITAAQLADVVAQENRRPTRDLPLAELSPNEIHPMTRSPYDGLLLLGSDDGTPIITFTCPAEPGALPVAPPSASYLGTIARGLADAHDLTPADIARHLHQAPGMTPTWTLEKIEALLE